MKDQLKWDYFDLGLDYFDDAEYHNAMEQFEKALEIDPAMENAIAYKSFTITELESLEKALEYIESQVEEYPDYGSLYYLKANILSDLERFKEANDYLDLALEKGFEEEVTYYARAYNYLGLEDCEKAVPFFEKHLKTYVDDIQSRCNLINCLNSLSQFEEALKCGDKARLTDPDYYLVYSYQGNSWMGLEDYEKALKCYKKALELNPGDENAIMNMETLKKLN